MQNHDKLRTLSTAAYGGTVIGESSCPQSTAHVFAKCPEQFNPISLCMITCVDLRVYMQVP